MRKNKYLFVLVLLLAITLVGSGITSLYLNYEEKTEAKETLTVVTSFYPMYVAAMNVIGDCEGVTLSNLSEPQTGCLHDYQLTPADMKLLSTADVFIVNGGGIESFLSDVAEQYPDLTILNTTEDVELIEDNAHAWMDMERYKQQVNTIAAGLESVDSANGHDYEHNAYHYCEEVDELIAEAEEVKESIPADTHVILFHEAFAYLAETYGLEVSYVMDLDEERQVSAGEVADVLAEIREHGVSVILAEELYGKDMGDTVEKESDVKVSYLDSLVRGAYEADSYLNAMHANIEQVKEAFAQ